MPQTQRARSGCSEVDRECQGRRTRPVPHRSAWRAHQLARARRRSLEAAIEANDPQLPLQPADPTRTIKRLFGAAPREDVIHVLVKVPRHVAPPPAKRRKLLTDLKREIATPSSFSKTKHGNSYSWVRVVPQCKAQIECHRIDWGDEDATALPVVLLNEVFARFDANCKSIELTVWDTPFALELCRKLSTPFRNEAELPAKSRELLNEYLFEYLPDCSILPISLAHATSDGSYFCNSKLLLNVEFRRGRGEGDGDPTMQNIAYYIHVLPDRVDCQIPSFVLDICGPLLGVSGIVNLSDEKLVCDPLSLKFPVILFDNDDMLVGLARLCASLKFAVRELRKFISCNAVTLKPPIDQLEFPYKNSYEKDDIVTTFRYNKRIQRFTFEAQTESGLQVIVKLSRTYSKEVHEYCANAGVAPTLLHYEVLVNGWIFVVMEKLEAVLLAEVLGTGTVTKSTLESKVRRIQRLLRPQNYVHGDLRESNLMWEESRNELKMIDFDWAGKDGEAFYPPFLNTEVKWPGGVAPGKVLIAAHDDYWLNLLLREASQY
ncbi:hypothetical protein PHYPSEUDO_007685 [Phytophthora pseudosyringae]|uniref:Aminoglycoside phosphotransferase domain-containing protein n=1 Tax=Phytophthora pseudosyringae TaxID=221518 RepID=A0A8T1VIV5_9STRA|nr:hypothetical protein PHYPSEUDO_007685 [Phytophthora pseudosyringae]